MDIAELLEKQMRSLTINDIPESRNLFQGMPDVALDWLDPLDEMPSPGIEHYEGFLPMVLELRTFGPRATTKQCVSMCHFGRDNMWFASNAFETYNSGFLRSIVPSVKDLEVVSTRSVYDARSVTLDHCETVHFSDETVLTSRTWRTTSGSFYSMSQYTCIEDGEEVEYLFVRNTDFPCKICGAKKGPCGCPHEAKVQTRSCGMTPINNNHTMHLHWTKYREFVGDIVNNATATCSFTLHKMKRRSVSVSEITISTVLSYHAYQSGDGVLPAARDMFIRDHFVKLGPARTMVNIRSADLVRVGTLHGGEALAAAPPQWDTVNWHGTEQPPLVEAPQWDMSFDDAGRGPNDIVNALLYDLEFQPDMATADTDMLGGDWGSPCRSTRDEHSPLALDAENSLYSTEASQEPDSRWATEPSAAAKLLPCRQCERVFKKSYDLRRHVASAHEGESRFDCTVCGLKDLDAADLSQHIWTMHGEGRQTSDDGSDLPSLERSDLGRLLAASEEAVARPAGAGDEPMRQDDGDDGHKEGKKYSCDQCDKAFKRSYDLRRHVTTVHEKQRNFSCKQCSFKFLQAAHLSEHVSNVHERVRPSYGCDKCDLTFPSKSRLRRHEKSVHLRLRPYVCAACNSRFFQRTDLKKHELVKHGMAQEAVAAET